MGLAMTKKTKKESALDWRTGKGYPDHGIRTDLWAWEFLRRNDEYRRDWKQFADAAEALRGEYGKPSEGKPGEWDGQEKNPHWIVARAGDDGDYRATVCTPPRIDGETEAAWIARVGRGHISPLDVSLGKRWGLERIADPAACNGFRWAISPFGVRYIGPYADNKEQQWGDLISRIAALLKDDVPAADAISQAKAIAAYGVSAWQRRKIEMQERNKFSTPRENILLSVDMRVSIPEQLKHARGRLQHDQQRWKKAGGTVWVGGRKRTGKRPGESEYRDYLRVLDALEELGHPKKGDTSIQREIALSLCNGYGGCRADAVSHADLSAVANWIKRADELSKPDGYLRLVAMAERQTLEQMVSASQE